MNMEPSLIKKINQYFHDEEARFFTDRHCQRIKRESGFYGSFFNELSSNHGGRATVVDIGSGTGLVAEALSGRGLRLICTDISFNMLANIRSRAMAGGNSLFYALCDAGSLPFESGAADFITCNAAMHHFPVIDEFIREAHRILAPRGVLVVGFESNRRFWTNRWLSLPYRLIARLNKTPSQDTSDYHAVCQRVNEQLLSNGAISSPLSEAKILECVDIHSPNAGGRIDYSKGFDIRELLEKSFEGFEARVVYHYDSLPWILGFCNRLLFPRSAPKFSLVLRKKLALKTKILFLYVHLDYGGAEVGLLTTLKNIDRNRFECVVVSIEKKGAVAEEIERLGIRVIYLNSRARLFNLFLIGRITRVLKGERPDILHASLFYANFFGRVAALFQRPPVVITEERSMYTEKRFYHVLADWALSRLSDRIIVCSRSVLDFNSRQERIPKDKFFLIYNAVDNRRFNVSDTKGQLRERLGFSGGDFIIGTVGSLIPKKGHRFLIEAGHMLSRDIPDLKILIIGEGPEEGDLRELVDLHKLEDKVILLGARKEIPELMKMMDVFSLPSLQEGFPRSVLEAMYSGLPVVASNISGIPELVLEGETGFLVPPAEPAALCAKFMALYKNPDLRREMGIKGCQRVTDNFLPGRYLERLTALYRDLLIQNNTISA